jgi:quinol monooxygenase YgiN
VSGTGTEISFRLGPGTVEEARLVAGRLAAVATGCLEHVLFVDAEAGEYGCLATWASPGDAAAYAAGPHVAVVLDALEERTGRRPRVRTYTMEHQVPSDA